MCFVCHYIATINTCTLFIVQRTNHISIIRVNYPEDIDVSASEIHYSNDNNSVERGTGSTNIGDNDEIEFNLCAKTVNDIQRAITSRFVSNRRLIFNIIGAVMLVGYFCYVAYCMWYKFGDEGSIRLLVGTLFGVILLATYLLWNIIERRCNTNMLLHHVSSRKTRRIIRWFV